MANGEDKEKPTFTWGRITVYVIVVGIAIYYLVSAVI